MAASAACGSPRWPRDERNAPMCCTQASEGPGLPSQFPRLPGRRVGGVWVAPAPSADGGSALAGLARHAVLVQRAALSASMSSQGCRRSNGAAAEWRRRPGNCEAAGRQRRPLGSQARLRRPPRHARVTLWRRARKGGVGRDPCAGGMQRRSCKHSYARTSPSPGERGANDLEP